MINDDAAGKTDQVTSRFASIEAHTIFIDRIRMHRVRHADFEVTNLLRAAFADGASFLVETFAFDPKTCFENGHDFRAKLLSQRQKIAQVVRVRVREKNRLEAVKFFPRFRAAGVGRYPGVDQCDLPGRSGQRKSAVAEIGDAVAFEAEQKIPFVKGYC